MFSQSRWFPRQLTDVIFLFTLKKFTDPRSFGDFIFRLISKINLLQTRDPIPSRGFHFSLHFEKLPFHILASPRLHADFIFRSSRNYKFHFSIHFKNDFFIDFLILRGFRFSLHFEQKFTIDLRTSSEPHRSHFSLKSEKEVLHTPSTPLPTDWIFFTNSWRINFSKWILKWNPLRSEDPKFVKI